MSGDTTNFAADAVRRENNALRKNNERLTRENAALRERVERLERDLLTASTMGNHYRALADNRAKRLEEAKHAS